MNACILINFLKYKYMMLYKMIKYADIYLVSHLLYMLPFLKKAQNGLQ